MAHANHTLAPYVYGSTGALIALTALLAEARSLPIDAALLGDSRFTSPGGRGIATAQAMNAMSAAMFGPLGALPWAPMYSSGSGAPAGTFPYRIANNGQGTTLVNLAANGNLLPCGFLHYTPNNNAGGGFMAVAQPDNYSGSKTGPGTVGSKFFDVNQSTLIDVILANKDGATTNDLLVQLLDLPTTAFNWGATVLGSATDASLGLNQAQYTCVKKTYGPFNGVSANPYRAVNCRNSTAPAGNNFQILSHRPRYATGGGLVFTAMGLGGARIADLLNDTTNGGLAGDVAGVGSMKNAGTTFPKFGFRLVVQLSGQNDAGADFTVAAVKAATLNLINTVRGWVGFNILWILVNNPHNGGLSAARQTLESTYAQAYTQLADEVPNVIFFNQRRALEETRGWNVTSGPTTDTSRPGSFPTAWLYRGPWTIGTAYNVSDVVNLDGITGVAIPYNTGDGVAIAPGDTLTQAVTGATGIFVGDSTFGAGPYVTGTMYVIPTNATAFSGANVITSGGGQTRTQNGAQVADQLYARSQAYAGAANDHPLDFNPRRYWRCISAHTAIWGRKPGSESQDRNGWADWEPVYPFYDPLDPAHWHGWGAQAFAGTFGLLLGYAENQALRSSGFSASSSGGARGMRLPRF